MITVELFDEVIYNHGILLMLDGYFDEVARAIEIMIISKYPN